MGTNETGQVGTWLLAIDSSTEQAGVALTDGDRMAELGWHAGRDQSRTLLAAVDELLALQGLALADLAGIVAATGPGAFTALRVGLGTAKGLAFALGLPLLGVSTLDATAYPLTSAGVATVATVAAGRGRVVWAPYAAGAGSPHATAEPRNDTLADLLLALDALPGRPVVSGDLPREMVRALAEHGANVVPPALRWRRPATLAALAWDRLAAGERDDAASLAPVYLHG
ncbi:MAG: tRNA (adenosine(37)-N6)-threonylcarbamoyltransferase complex dimerization subunit type 1 TsaB [Thermomicrobiales bacterium]